MTYQYRGSRAAYDRTMQQVRDIQSRVDSRPDGDWPIYPGVKMAEGHGFPDYTAKPATWSQPHTWDQPPGRSDHFNAGSGEGKGY